jgi:hypothetical protein
MQLTMDDKTRLLHQAVEIAKAAAGSGIGNAQSLASIIETTFKKMIELAEQD